MNINKQFYSSIKALFIYLFIFIIVFLFSSCLPYIDLNKFGPKPQLTSRSNYIPTPKPTPVPTPIMTQTPVPTPTPTLIFDTSTIEGLSKAIEYWKKQCSIDYQKSKYNIIHFLTQRSQMFYQKGDYSYAIEDADEILRMSEVAESIKAQVRITLGKSIVERCITNMDDNLRAYDNLMNSYLYYFQSKEWKSANEAIYYCALIINTFQTENALEKSIEYFSVVINSYNEYNLNSDNILSNSYYQRGLLYYMKGDYEKSDVDFSGHNDDL